MIFREDAQFNWNLRNSFARSCYPFTTRGGSLPKILLRLLQLNMDDFKYSGHAKRSLRQPIQNAEKSGVTVQEVDLFKSLHASDADAAHKEMDNIDVVAKVDRAKKTKKKKNRRASFNSECNDKGTSEEEEKRYEVVDPTAPQRPESKVEACLQREPTTTPGPEDNSSTERIVDKKLLDEMMGLSAEWERAKGKTASKAWFMNRRYGQ